MKSLQLLAATLLILLGVILLSVTVTSMLGMSQTLQMWATVLLCIAALLFIAYESLGGRPLHRGLDELRSDARDGWERVRALWRRGG